MHYNASLVVLCRGLVGGKFPSSSSEPYGAKDKFLGGAIISHSKLTLHDSVENSDGGKKIY